MKCITVLVAFLMVACGKVSDDAEPQRANDAAAPPPDAAGVLIPDGGLGLEIDPSFVVVPCQTGFYGGTSGYAEPEGTEAIYAVLTNTRCPNRDGTRGRPAGNDCHAFGTGGSPFTYYSCGAPVICPRVADPSCDGRAYECSPGDPETVDAIKEPRCTRSGARLCCP